MAFNLRGPELLILFLFVAIIVGVIFFIVWLVKMSSRPSIPPAATGTPTSQPPGWYPVPDGSGRVDWWDGDKWAPRSGPGDQP